MIISLDFDYSSIPASEQKGLQGEVQQRQTESPWASPVYSVVLVGLVAMVVIGSLSLNGRFPLSDGGGIALTVIGGGMLGTFALICCYLCCQCNHQAKTFERSINEPPPPAILTVAPPTEGWAINPFQSQE